MKQAFISFFNFLHPIVPLINHIHDSGGITYLVGGSVRDLVMDKELKDFDIEVHNLSLQQLENILKTAGPIMAVGKKFGVLRIAGLDIDWSLPRKDSKGRKPVVAIDPSMKIADACRRRDLTMNAMAIDLYTIVQNKDLITKSLEAASSHTGNTFIDAVAQALTIIDPYNGIDAIKHHQLRAVDQELFLEDPLRFYRVMQFIGRFEMLPDDALNQLCASMSLFDVTAQTPVAQERIHDEMKKLFLKSRRPSLGIRWLLTINRLEEIFPELNILRTTPQKPNHHPEGDVFEHTMQTLDAAAQLTYYIDQESLSADEEKFLIMLGALCHDLGKPAALDAEGHFYCHEHKGLGPTKRLLKRITNNQWLIKAVLKIVRHHIAPFTLLAAKAGLKSYKRLAIKLTPEITLRQLGLIALADNQGRNPASHEPLTEKFHDVYEQFLARIEQAQVTHGPEAPVLLGRHLLDCIVPGPAMGKLLKEAYHIQLEEGVKDVDELKRRVLGSSNK